MASFEPVRAVQRGLAVLRIISEQGPLPVAEIARLSDLPQPTAVRIVETLMADGYVFRVVGSKSYMVSGRTKVLSRGFDKKSQLLSVASAHIDQLHLKIGWPSNLAVFDNDAMVIIYTNRASLGLSMPARTGARLPMTATGVGLVALAFMEEDARAPVIAALGTSGSRWDADIRLHQGLAERLAAVHDQGYALADEGYLDSIYQSRIWAVAVPIISEGGRFIAGISSLVLREAGDRSRLLRKILPRLRAAASKIAESFE